MEIEDALSIDGVLGLTCPRSDDRLVLERWKACGHCLPGHGLFVRVRQVLERVWVDRVCGIYQQSKAGAVMLGRPSPVFGRFGTEKRVSPGGVPNM